jgi:hypothetical protein
MSQIVRGIRGSIIHNIAAVHRMGIEVPPTASEAQPAEIPSRIGRQTLGEISLNAEIGSKGELVIGRQAIGRNRRQVANVWILEDASKVVPATEPAIATPAADRAPETPAQIAEEAEIALGIAAFPVAADREIPARLAAVAPVEAAHAAAALAVHPVWAAADRVVADQGAAAAAGDAVADSGSQC